MDVNNINSQTAAAYKQPERAGKSEMGQQEFLQLLIAQMQNQDPMNPMDGNEFASQLAQFNSVEQLIGVNAGLKNLQGTQNMMSASLTNSMAASLTGKQVRALSNQVYLSASDSAEVQFKLNNIAEEVDVIIRNASGAEIRRETLKGVASGDNTWQWDGLNNSGDRMGEGNYYVEVKAKNGDKPVGSLVFIEGVANKVRYSGEGVLLTVNGVEVPIGDVEEVGINLF